MMREKMMIMMSQDQRKVELGEEIVGQLAVAKEEIRLI
jgi:hypothetical protein